MYLRPPAVSHAGGTDGSADRDVNLARFMVARGLRTAFGSRPSMRMLRNVAGATPRDRQRFVLGAAYPYMFLLSLPFAGAAGLASWCAAKLDLRSVWLNGLFLGVALIPAGILAVLLVATWSHRLRRLDPAELILSKDSDRVLQRISLVGYAVALVLGFIAVHTWARV